MPKTQEDDHNTDFLFPPIFLKDREGEMGSPNVLTTRIQLDCA